MHNFLLASDPGPLLGMAKCKWGAGGGGIAVGGGVETNCEKLRENCGKIAEICGKIAENCGKIATL